MMECPICGYDNMDAYADEGRIVYSCPSCDRDSAHGFIVLKKEITVFGLHISEAHLEIQDNWMGETYCLKFDFDSLIDENTFRRVVKDMVFAQRNRRLGDMPQQFTRIVREEFKKDERP